MKQIKSTSQNKKTPDERHLLICKFSLVRLLDYRWNHFTADLYLVHSKLEKFGLAYINDKVIYLGDEELGSV